MAVCTAAGGVKILVDLIKAWVEERNGRKIKIKKGDVEIELQGGLTEKQITQTIELFEKHFNKSNLIKLD